MDFFEKDFGKILKQNALEQRRAFIKGNSDCGRVYDRNLAQFPVTVDLYGSYAKIVDYGDTPMTDEMVETVSDICRRMLYIEKAKVVFQRRPKREPGQQHETQEAEPIWTWVSENGLKFKVNLSTHVDTGLFLDQMNNRIMIEEQSMGRDVLNLFSYTGSFSVYAARGGARSVDSVDLSNTYTSWAHENLKENGYSGEAYSCINEDAKVFVSEAIKRKAKYDIIIFDPPCFSNSRKMDYDFDVQRDYVNWLAGLYKLLRKDGFILFSTNLATFGFDGIIKRRNKVKEITLQSKAPGFTSRIGSARSWILEKDEERLTLDWDDSAPVKKTVRKSTKKAVKEDVQSENAVQETEEKVEAAVEVVEEAVAEEKVEAIVEETAAEEAGEIAEEIEEAAEDDSEESEDESEEEVSEDDVEKSEAADDKAYGKNEWKGGDDRRSDRDYHERRSFDDRDRPAYRERSSYGRRDDRPSYRDRDSRPSYGDRDSRPSYRDRNDRDSRPSYRDSRPSYRDRDSRPSYGDRDSRPSYRDRDSRPSYGDRDSRPSYRDRDSRPSYGDRDSRSSYRDRDSRPSYGDRDSRPSYRDRDSKPSYGDRDSRPSYRDRDSKPSYGDRDSRPSFRDRDSRPSYGDRDSRPSFRDRDSRPSYGDRDSRPSFRDKDSKPSFGRDSYRGRDDRRSFDTRKSGDSKKPYGYDSFKPARDRNDSKQFFWLDEDDSKKEDK